VAGVADAAEAVRVPAAPEPGTRMSPHAALPAESVVTMAEVEPSENVYPPLSCRVTTTPAAAAPPDDASTDAPVITSHAAAWYDDAENRSEVPDAAAAAGVAATIATTGTAQTAEAIADRREGPTPA